MAVRCAVPSPTMGTPPGRLWTQAARPAYRSLPESGACRKKGALPKPLVRLHTLLQRGLTGTASLWPAVRVAYRWVHRAAHILTNEDEQPGATVKRSLA